MKYNEQKFAKFIGGPGFFAILACCVLIIGAATWFAVSRYNESKADAVREKKQNESYIAENESYNNNEATVSKTPDVTEEVAESVSDEPYSSSQTESQVVPQTFVAPVEGTISKTFSETKLQFSATFGDLRIHKGVDIACEKGSSVKSIGTGVVSSVEEGTTLGNTVTIDYGDGLTVKFCGIEGITVAANQKIASGEGIGVVGTVTNECADQSHIHIEAYKDGAAISLTEILEIE